MRVGRLITIIMLTIFFTLVVSNFTNASCSSDADCGVDKICVYNNCVDKPPDCETNSNCTSNEYCRDDKYCTTLSCVSSHTDSSCYVKPVGHECVNCETSGKVCNSAGTACELPVCPDTADIIRCGYPIYDALNTVCDLGEDCSYDGISGTVCNTATATCSCVSPQITCGNVCREPACDVDTPCVDSSKVCKNYDTGVACDAVCVVDCGSGYCADDGFCKSLDSSEFSTVCDVVSKFSFLQDVGDHDYVQVTYDNCGGVDSYSYCRFCDGSVCGSCGFEPCSSGDVVCESGVLKTCVADVNGCFGWSEVACDQGYCSDSSTCGGCTNLDGDLYALESECNVDGLVDCDDSDPDRFPGNVEVCDGKDNDCDGEADY